MKIEVKEEKENPLLHRKEVRLILRDFSETPSKKDTTSEIAKTLKTKEELVFIGEIRQEYGKSEALCYAEIYETAEHKAEYRPEPKKKDEAKKEPEAEQPKEEPKEEKKPEEKKEEEPKEAE
jgi:ribosomal protein S24E